MAGIKLTTSASTCLSQENSEMSSFLNFDLPDDSLVPSKLHNAAPSSNGELSHSNIDLNAFVFLSMVFGFFVLSFIFISGFLSMTVLLLPFTFFISDMPSSVITVGASLTVNRLHKAGVLHDET